MSELLFTVLIYDGKYISEEHRIYEPSNSGYHIPRLEILHGVVRSSGARQASKKLENVSQAPKKRTQQRFSRSYRQQPKKVKTKA